MFVAWLLLRCQKKKKSTDISIIDTGSPRKKKKEGKGEYDTSTELPRPHSMKLRAAIPFFFFTCIAMDGAHSAKQNKQINKQEHELSLFICGKAQAMKPVITLWMCWKEEIKTEKREKVDVLNSRFEIQLDTSVKKSIYLANDKYAMIPI